MCLESMLLVVLVACSELALISLLSEDMRDCLSNPLHPVHKDRLECSRGNLADGVPLRRGVCGAGRGARHGGLGDAWCCSRSCGP